MNKAELVISNTTIAGLENKSFHFRLNVPSDFIHTFVCYMSLFYRYCMVVKNKKVYCDIRPEGNDVVIELGVGHDLSLDLARKYFEEYIGFIAKKANLIAMEDLVEGVVDEIEFVNFQKRLMEERKHFLMVLTLEFGLKVLVQSSDRKVYDDLDFRELELIQKGYELEIENYQLLIKNIKLATENKGLLEDNNCLKEQIVKIEKEKELLIHQIIDVINNKITIAENIITNNPDKEKITQLVVEDEIDEVFSMLKLVKKKRLWKEIVLLQNQWHSLQKQIRLRMADAQFIVVEKSRIVLSVLEIIETL